MTSLGVFYTALALWVGLLGWSLARGRFRLFFVAGLLFTVVLNARYLLGSPGEAAAFFVGIYDPLHNAGLSDPSAAPALVPCAPGEPCSVLAGTYDQHPSWGVAFYERFTKGAVERLLRLQSHVVFNTAAFVLMMFQLF